MKTVTVTYKNYQITTDRNQLQPEAVHRWLSQESYWAKDIPYDVVKAAFDHSFVIGALFEGTQIAYARLVTDYATFAYLADVYVEEAHRGLGVSKQLMAVIMDLDWVKSLRRIILTTMDAHGLYAQFGFIPVPFPERIMVINKVNMYQQSPAQNSSLESTD